MAHLETEKTSSVTNSGGLFKRGGGEISAISLDGGTAATGATVTIHNSASAAENDIWTLRASQYGTTSIVFTKPIPFTNGIYLTLTPSGATAKVSIAHT